MSPAPSTSRPLEGRTILITGATSGIGQRTAENLSALGAEILLCGRDPARVENVAGTLKEAGRSVSPFVADLTDRTALRSLVTDVRSRHSSLDALVNNAGALFYDRAETPFGSERTFALNVEAPFMLTELLLPLLVRSGHGRVIYLSSSAHRAGRMHFDDLDLRRGYSSWKAYGQSKLALLLLTREEAKIHQGLPVTFNACHPGFVRSRFGDNGTGLAVQMFRTVKWIGGTSVARGARTPTFLASSPEVEGVSGEYFVRARIRSPSRSAQGPADSARLWRMLEERTGLAVYDGAERPTPTAPAA